MEKFIPFEKLSKKKKRELMTKRRGTWGGLNPVTRKPPNPKGTLEEGTKWILFHDLQLTYCSIIFHNKRSPFSPKPQQLTESRYIVKSSKRPPEAVDLL